MTSVLLIDDDVELLGMLQDYLAHDGFSVHAEHDGQAGLMAALSGQYDIAVLDVMMPGRSGIETLRLLRQQSQLPVLMLTAKGDDTDRILGLELGADDYVPKPCTPRELSARIRAILRRAQTQASDEPGNVLVYGPLELWPGQRRVTWAGELVRLTGTEFNLLAVLMLNPGKTVSKNELSEKALGRPMAKFDRNIDVHMSSLRHKLGTLPDGRSCIHTVHRQGFLLMKE